MNIPNLRSPYDTVGGLVHFGRMLDKIRLHAQGRLPADYVPNLGQGFDGRCCQFLGIDYADLVARLKLGGADEDILAWALDQGRHPTADEIEIWSDYLRKRGWNDSASERLAQRVQESAPQWVGKIHTFFDFLEIDEGRPPRAH